MEHVALVGGQFDVVVEEGDHFLHLLPVRDFRAADGRQKAKLAEQAGAKLSVQGGSADRVEFAADIRPAG